MEYRNGVCRTLRIWCGGDMAEIWRPRRMRASDGSGHVKPRLSPPSSQPARLATHAPRRLPTGPSRAGGGGAPVYVDGGAVGGGACEELAQDLGRHPLLK